MSESGIYYVVPDRHADGGKKLVRRHLPPLTSVPLDDDFDAITQTQGYTAITPTIERIENESYYSHYGYDRDGQTSVPLDDNFDAVTYEVMTTKGGWEGYGEEAERKRAESGRASGKKGYDDLVKTSPPRSSDTSRRSSGQRKASGEQGHGLNGRDVSGSGWGSIDGTARWGGRTGGAERSTQRYHTGTEAGPVRSRTMSEVQRRPKPAPMGSSKSLSKRGGGLMSNGEVAKPTRLGEQFEMVRRKIIEDSPEKTVTISMWRENVAEQSGGGNGTAEVGMSVYYVNPDDYAIEVGGDARREEIVTEVRTEGDHWHGEERRMIEDDSKGRERSRPIRMDGQSILSYNVHGYGDRHKSVSPFRQESLYGGYTPARTSTPTKHSTGSSRQYGRGERWSPTSTNTTMVMNTNMNTQTRKGSTCSPSSSQQGRNQMSLAARNILASCTPSLLHVAPILVRLGITTEEHLRAMMRLSEDTRDRVVRDEALRKGITVMEWAILLDRLREL